MDRIIPVCLLALISFELAAQIGSSPTREVYISRVPKKGTEVISFTGSSRPTAPPNIKISDVTFSDDSGNGNSMLDADEEAEIRFMLTNAGKGNARSMAADVVPINIKDRIELLFDKKLGDLAPGESIQVTLPIRGISLLESGKAELEIRIGELNGFDADPIRLVFNTQRSKVPEVSIADFTVGSSDGGGIALGHPIVLTVMLQNKGQGEAVDIRAEFKVPENVFPAAESSFHIDRLMPNETRSIAYEFFGNKKYNGSDIPIEVSMTDGHGQFEQTHTLRIPVDGSAGTVQTFSIAAGSEKLIPIERMSLRSDVDVDVPRIERNAQNRFALIIGNEDYKKYQTGLQADQNVMFARNDAVVFKEYAVNTLGVSEKHAFILTDATRGQMSREIERITELAKLTPNAEIIFYYAGHGLPNLETQESYLVPVDVTASNLSDAIKLRDLYSKLASSRASRIMVFLDACFSGGGRGENGLLAARTVKIRPKSEIVEGNIVAFTATSGKEVSLPFEKQAHGLFTYYLLKKLQETQGDLTLDELGQHLEQEIPKASLLENSILQRPQVLVSPELDEKWTSWKF